MAQNAASKIHTVTRSYLDAWALPPGGVLRPVSVQYGHQKPKTPAAVGWVRDWWGAGDPALNEACEQACAKLENIVPPLLRNAEQHWPFPDDDERAKLAQFIALHVIPTDAVRDWLELASEDSLHNIREKWTSSMPFEVFATEMRSDKQRAIKLLGMLNKVASWLGSMHWTLVRFAEPIIITCDHPVCLLPLLDDGQIAEVNAAPIGGFSNIVEFRFPLSPLLVLLGSWHPGDESDKPVDGDWNDAANVNGVVRAQAGRQWFRAHPAPMPAFPPMIFREVDLSFEPLTPRFIPGYGAVPARESPRRLGVIAEVEKLIERQDENAMFLARPQIKQSAA